jgi:two-component system, OmpR family, sensor kinase
VTGRAALARVPILVRLTATFALATLLVLCAAALFVGLRLRADLDERIDVSLERRSQAALAAYRSGTELRDLALTLEDREEVFVQLLTAKGEVIDSGGTLIGPAIRPDEAARAEAGLPLLERELPGVDGRARMLVTPVRLGSGGPGVLVVGTSLVDRRDALSSVATSFLIGGVLSLFAASTIGYGVARVGLAPVEAMRRKARTISLSGAPELLPLPPAHDELRRLGETLNEMLRGLRDAFDRERRLVADASHELRTPLATVRLELENALDAQTPDAERRAALLAAHTECLRLTRLADDLLVLARLDDGRLPLRRSRTDLSALLRSVCEQYIDRGRVLGRRVELAVPAGLVVTVDPDRISQLVTNLVDNAWRHGAGTVMISAARVPGGVELVVSDEGAGLAAEFVGHAFERFSQADPSRSAEGAGLGLALVAAIAEAHDGDAEVDAERPAAIRVRLADPNADPHARAAATSHGPLIPGS